MLPLTRQAIARAIELNGVAVDFNLRAFELGRQFADNPAAVLEAAGAARADRVVDLPETLDRLVARREAALVDYQGPRYAARFRQLVDAVRERERLARPGSERLARSVAINYHRLLAYKDEYEVARMYLDPEFRSRLDREFEPGYRVEFQLAPPLFTATDPATGRPRKRAFGPWILGLFRLLRPLRRLRGTAFDPFGYQAERRQERRLIDEYERSVEDVLEELCEGNLDSAAELLEWPARIRGFGPVKAASIPAARERRDRLLDRFRGLSGSRRAA